MAGYHSDQYFNLANAGEDVSTGGLTRNAGFLVKGADNPTFVYPDRSIRTEYGGDKSGHFNVAMKRGYIRSLVKFAGGQDISIRKCAFQFNPAVLTQSVSANDSMLNFLQQDPAQYAQPMPGNVNFTFDLFFDRSMEVNNSHSDAITNGSLPSNIINPWEQSDVSEVGVLRDIGAFYGVIGQGLSTQMMGYLQQSLNQEAAGVNANASTDEDKISADKAISNLEGFKTINVANSAFILPMPVRIVFSGLYIVEGLVTNTTVSYTKFNTNMVPMQCALNCTVEAKYIGFAKAQTFFTQAIAAQEETAHQEATEKNDRVKGVLGAISSMADTMQVAFGINQRTAISETDMTPASLRWMIGADSSPNLFGVFSTFPRAEAAGDAPGDFVLKAFDEGVSLSISADAQCALYGPFTTVFAPGQIRTQEAIKSFIANANVGVAHVASHSSSGTAATADEWKNMKNKVRSTYTKTFEDHSGADTSKSYIVKYTGQVRVTTEGQTLNGEGEYYVVYDTADTVDPQLLTRTLSMAWPNLSSDGVVKPDNASTAPPPPGSINPNVT